MSTTEEMLQQAMQKWNPAPSTPSTPAGGGAPISSPTQASAALADTAGKAARDVAQGARDSLTSVWRGVTGAANEAAQNVNDATNWVSKHLGVTPGYLQFGNNDDGSFVKWYDQARDKIQPIPNSLIPAQSTSTTGKLIENVTQFGVGMLAAGKFAKLAQIPEAASVAGKVVQTAVKGGLVDMSVFDAAQQRLSNLVQEHPEISNPVTKFLAADPKDGFATAKLKQGLEGVLSGVALESLVQGAAIVKKSRLLSDPAIPREQAVQELTSQLQESDKILNDAEKGAKFTVVETDNGFQIKAKGADEYHPTIFTTKAAADSEAGTLNMINIEHQKMQPVGALTSDQVQAIKDRALDLMTTNDPADLKKLAEGTDFNFSRMTDTEPKSDTSIVANPKFSTGNITAFDITRPEGPIGLISTLPEGENAVRVSTTSMIPEFKGKGYGSDAYRQLADKVLGEGKELWSDSRVSEDASRLYDSLQKKGYAVEKNPDAVLKDGDWVTKGDKPVYKVTSVPTPVDTPDPAKVWIESISNVMRKQIDAARGGDLVTHKMLLGQIKDTFPDANPDQILAALSKSHDTASDLAVNISAGRLLMYNIGKKVSDLSALVDGDPNNALNMARLGQGLDNLFQVAARLKGTSTNVARALEAHSMDVSQIADAVDATPNPAPAAAAADGAAPAASSALQSEIDKAGAQSLSARKILASLQGMTPDQMRTLARRLRMADGDPTAMLAVAQSAARDEAPKGLINYHNEYWINALLSGPRTHAVKMMADVSKTVMNPTEMWLAGSIASRDPELRTKAADLLMGNFAAARESWSAAAKALKIGDNVLTSDIPTNEGGADGVIGGYLGKLVRLPSRLLMTEDEFFKQMAYRSNIRMQALQQARGMGLEGDKLGQYVSDAMDAAFTPDGRGVNKIGLNYANDVTSTSDLTGPVKDFADMTNKYPGLKILTPFIKVPSNLMSYTWKHTPGLAYFNSQVRADLAAGGERRALAITKQGVGGMVYTTGALLAAQGIVTGQGPGNPELRAQWLQSHQPYSIYIDGKPYEYKRLDPVLMPLGIISDLVHSSGELQGSDISDLATGFASAVASNISSKTYLAGLTDMMDALTSKSPTYMKEFLETRAATYVPGILNQINPDDTMREVRGYVDAVLNHLPGMSQTLPARRNIFGEPVMKAPGELNRSLNPFTLGATPKGDGSVEAKLLELGKAVQMPMKYAPGTEGLAPGVRVDLTSRQYGLHGDMTPYDRMLQLTAEPGNGQPSLREVLTKFVNGPSWDKLSAGASIEPGGTRLDIVNKLIQDNRQAAFIKVRKEFPELNKAIIQAQMTAQVAKVKGDAGVQQIKELFNKDKP